MGGLAQHRQQPLHRPQRQLAAIIADDGHHLVRSQVQGGASQRIARCMHGLHRCHAATFCNLEELACVQL
ncbi:hypothetical protein A6R73_18635 [Xanthomonas translucens pv. poae]|uniref:Uncharacterized protein n=1 Tax=Xanthomonas graminis pv. poae TaxID=227946 RepID=A0A199P1S5_9XANT|nr:hypothetical protein A6R73_18635 [Xanthomonas translucens pv. poae]